MGVLQDEIADQDEVINKLNKEKKHIAETQAKSNDDMVSVNEKVGHLASVKSKLESTLGELEGSLDRKNHERMQALIDQLQGKVKSYKKQIEEAEEIAALNLAKYRKVAGALGDAEASADANEQAMAM